MGQFFFLSQNGWGFAIILIVKLLPLLRFSENLNNNHSMRLKDGRLGDNFFATMAVQSNIEPFFDTALLPMWQGWHPKVL